MPIATPMSSGVYPAYSWACRLKTGKNMNSPSMRREKMPDSAATARRSIGDIAGDGASAAVSEGGFRAILLSPRQPPERASANLARITVAPVESLPGPRGRRGEQ